MRRFGKLGLGLATVPVLCLLLRSGAPGAIAQAPPAALPPEVVASASGPIRLGADPVVVTLVPALGTTGGGLTLGDQVAASAATHQRVYLVIRGARADAPPGTVFHAYLDLPQGAEPAAEDPRHVGFVNFYDVVPPRAGSALPGGPAAASEPVDRFEIASIVRNLSARGMLRDPLTVTFRAAGPPASGSHPTLRAVDLVIQ